MWANLNDTLLNLVHHKHRKLARRTDTVQPSPTYRHFLCQALVTQNIWTHGNDRSIAASQLSSRDFCWQFTGEQLSAVGVSSCLQRHTTFIQVPVVLPLCGFHFLHSWAMQDGKSAYMYIVRPCCKFMQIARLSTNQMHMYFKYLHD